MEQYKKLKERYPDLPNPEEITDLRKTIMLVMSEAAKLINPEGKTVLDIGIEGDQYPSGNYVFFKNAKSFETSDINPAFKPTYVDDITESTLPSNKFDVVICSQVIEHIWEVEKAFKHLYRIIKPGGYLVVDCPFMYPFHATQETRDYWRLTRDSLDRLTQSFSEKAISQPNELLIVAVCKK